MATSEASNGFLRVTLTADEIAGWRRVGIDGARFRIDIKRPARALASELGCARCTVYAADDVPLENVRIFGEEIELTTEEHIIMQARATAAWLRQQGWTTETMVEYDIRPHRGVVALLEERLSGRTATDAEVERLGQAIRAELELAEK